MPVVDKLEPLIQGGSIENFHPNPRASGIGDDVPGPGLCCHGVKMSCWLMPVSLEIRVDVALEAVLVWLQYDPLVSDGDEIPGNVPHCS